MALGSLGRRTKSWMGSHPLAPSTIASGAAMTIFPTLIQSVAHSSRDVTQPGSGRTTDAVSVQAAPIPIPQASSSQASAGNSAMIAITRVPPLSLHDDPCLSAQLAMGIR